LTLPFAAFVRFAMSVVRRLLLGAAVCLLWVTPAQAQEKTWKGDRSTPRKLLETFYYGVLVFDLRPDFIEESLACLDLNPEELQKHRSTAVLRALHLNEILSKLDLPLYSVPDRNDKTEVTLGDNKDLQIILKQQPDKSWKVDRQTIERIAPMWQATQKGQHALQAVRAHMAEHRTDPEATMWRFMISVVRKNFTAAAECLDLSGIPAKLWPTRGPLLARKLAFVIQRTGFVFPQEIPSDPDTPRYTWQACSKGRIVLERVRMQDGKEAWLFSRLTIDKLDDMIKAVKDLPIDPRYAALGPGVIIELTHLPDYGKTEPAPDEVPRGYTSARATLKTFLTAMEQGDLSESALARAIDCLDLSGLPEEDRKAIATRLVAKLEVIVRRLDLDLLTVSNAWNDEPQTFQKPPGLIVTLAQQPDKAWRFDQATVARINDMFNLLGTGEKTAKLQRSDFGSARDTVRTFVTAIKHKNFKLAAQCLDLSEIPHGAQDDVAAALAVKLMFVLDRLGPFFIQEIPADREGPPFYLYRGELGRIILARRTDESRKGDWLFTAATVAQVDALFKAVIDRPRPTGVSDEVWQLGEPHFWDTPSVWLYYHLPRWSHRVVLGLCLYHWIGFVVIALTSYWLGRLALAVGLRVVQKSICLAGVALSRESVFHQLRPLGWQCTLAIFFWQCDLLDLPVWLVGIGLPAAKILWTLLLLWSALRLIDLGMNVYTNSKRLNAQRTLSDMIVPTVAKALKVVALIVAITYLAYLIGSQDLVTKILAGFGLLGLAASLASQDSLKNYFGTLLLIGERPFKIGDHIVVGAQEGLVESVGFRSTRIRTFQDSVITIPNSAITNMAIENMGARNWRRYRCHVPLAYGTPIGQVVALRDQLRQFVRDHPRTRKDKMDIAIHNLGSNGIEMLVNVFFQVENTPQELEVRDELNRQILETADRLGVEIAVPTHKVHLNLPTESAEAAMVLAIDKAKSG
jgi:MscS family membrane protein